VLKPGGRIYINAHKNPFGKYQTESPKINGFISPEQLGLRVVQERGELDLRFAEQSFFRTDGIQIPSSSVKQQFWRGLMTIVSNYLIIYTLQSVNLNNHVLKKQL